MQQPRTISSRPRPRRWAVAAMVVGGMLVGSGWAQTTTRGLPINEYCPVMTEEKADPAFTTVYNGQVIGFCCDKCLAKFEANPDRYAARLIEVLKAENDADHSQHEHPATQAAGPQKHGDAETHVEEESATEQPGDGDAEAQHEGHEQPPAGVENDREHEHAHGHGHGSSFFSRLIGWLGNFHPPAVNFPIAMISGAALAELLLKVTGRVFYANAVRFCLWVGALGALGAAILGWFFGGFNLVDKSWILTTHRWLGTSTAVWAIMTLVIGERAFRHPDASRTAFRACLFVGAGLVSATGFFGGAMIYGISHYAW